MNSHHCLIFLLFVVKVEELDWAIWLPDCWFSSFIRWSDNSNKFRLKVVLLNLQLSYWLWTFEWRIHMLALVPTCLLHLHFPFLLQFPNLFDVNDCSVVECHAIHQSWAGVMLWNLAIVPSFSRVILRTLIRFVSGLVIVGLWRLWRNTASEQWA